MIQADLADFEARPSYFLKLAQGGEKVVICDHDKPVAELVPAPKPIDRKLRESLVGLFPGGMSPAELQEALRPMTDEEADAFVEGRL